MEGLRILGETAAAQMPGAVAQEVRDLWAHPQASGGEGRPQLCTERPGTPPVDAPAVVEETSCRGDRPWTPPVVGHQTACRGALCD